MCFLLRLELVIRFDVFNILYLPKYFQIYFKCRETESKIYRKNDFLTFTHEFEIGDWDDVYINSDVSMLCFLLFFLRFIPRVRNLNNSWETTFDTPHTQHQKKFIEKINFLLVLMNLKLEIEMMFILPQTCLLYILFCFNSFHGTVCSKDTFIDVYRNSFVKKKILPFTGQ